MRVCFYVDLFWDLFTRHCVIVQQLHHTGFCICVLHVVSICVSAYMHVLCEFKSNVGWIWTETNLSNDIKQWEKKEKLHENNIISDLFYHILIFELILQCCLNMKMNLYSLQYTRSANITSFLLFRPVCLISVFYKYNISISNLWVML